MSVTFGFYNSINGDRQADAVQMSKIFDGIIRDGIFMSIGTSMVVSAVSGMGIKVGVGRGWFDHTWTLNDAELPMDIKISELLLNRIDAVVVEINSTDAVRANSIKFVTGIPATEPARPTLIRTEKLNQYPLCYIYVGKGVTSITQADITNMVGTSECPFITGILDTINIDALIAQWQTQWTTWVTATQEANTTWTAAQHLDFVTWSVAQKDEYDSYISTFKTSSTNDFTTWFNNIKGQLGTDAAGNLLNLINEHKADLAAHVTQAKQDKWDAAVQSATIGGAAVSKSGTTLQIPMPTAADVGALALVGGYSGDLNSIAAQSICSADGNAANLPMAGYPSIVRTEIWDANFAYQQALTLAGTLYFRMKQNGTWGAWAKINDGGHALTADLASNTTSIAGALTVSTAEPTTVLPAGTLWAVV